jgi:hypothetical protein
MTGFSTEGRWAALGHAPEDCRTARVSGCLACRLEPARTTKHPTAALPEQPKITLIAAYAEHLKRANFSTTSAAPATLSTGFVMPLASSRARVT